MKNLHIHDTDKFTIPFIDFINKYFNSSIHNFIVLKPKKRKKLQLNNKNVQHFNSDLSGLLKVFILMIKADRIYLHNLFNNRILIILYLNPWLLKKCSWIVWGGDLYYYRESKNTFGKIVKEILRKRVIKNMDELLPIVEGDFKLAQKWYNTKARYRYNAIYPTNLELINSIKIKELREENKEIRILLGNSATITNRHEEALNKLSQFKEYNIKIFAPLSYGDMEYSKKVISEGKRIFNHKFIPLTEYINMKEYIEFLSSIDIGVFNLDRQQAMGNINLLLYFGKKIFLREESTIWEEINKNFYIHSIDKLDTLTISELNKQSNFEQKKNIKKASARYNIDKVKLHWEQIFEHK